MRVSEILNTKGNDVITVKPDETVAALSHTLREKRIGAVVVSSDGRKVLGIISERDVAHGLAEHGANVLTKAVSELMTTAVVTCAADDTIADLMKLMTNKRIRHLPVVENNDVIGIISVGDVVKHRLDEMQLEANVLRDYAIASH